MKSQWSIKDISRLNWAHYKSKYLFLQYILSAFEWYESQLGTSQKMPMLLALSSALYLQECGGRFKTWKTGQLLGNLLLRDCALLVFLQSHAVGLSFYNGKKGILPGLGFFYCFCLLHPFLPGCYLFQGL